MAKKLDPNRSAMHWRCFCMPLSRSHAYHDTVIVYTAANSRVEVSARCYNCNERQSVNVEGVSDVQADTLRDFGVRFEKDILKAKVVYANWQGQEAL
jgi:hypothetical protein